MRSHLRKGVKLLGELVMKAIPLLDKQPIYKVNQRQSIILYEINKVKIQENLTNIEVNFFLWFPLIETPLFSGKPQHTTFFFFSFFHFSNRSEVLCFFFVFFS